MEIKKYTEISGFLDEPDSNILLELAKDKDCFEIGSLRGKSTVCMASVAKKVVAIDTFRAAGNGASQTDDEKIYEQNITDFRTNTQGYDNIETKINKSDDIVPFFNNESFDLAFIDGSHEYDDVKNDIIMSWPKIKMGGYLAVHDYGKKGWDGVTRAVDELFCKHEINGPYHCLIYIKKEKGNAKNLCV
jgi:predicted O-methyltransferase YrrM